MSEVVRNAALGPYSEYKEYGDDWLGQVPEHWKVRKLRSVLKNVTERNRPDLPLLSVVREKGVIVRDVTDQDANHNYIPDDLTNYKVVRAGQFAMNKMKAWQGSYGVSQYDGIVSPAYFVFETSGVEGPYFHAAIRSRAYVPYFTRASDGVRIGQWDLSKDRMREIPFAVPPPDEQAAIVRFLNHVDGRIRRYIRAKRQLITLLNEQKQAVINKAVTKGLDVSVCRKPSGVEWIGEIPDHWEVEQLKRRWRIADCKHVTVPFVDEGIPLASVREVQAFELDLRSSNKTTPAWYQHLISGGRRPNVGDLIYCRNVSVGACAFIGTDEAFAMGKDVCLITSREQNQRFLNYVLHSEIHSIQLNQLLVGSTFKRINVDDIKALTVVVPPVPEQSEIVRYLDAVLPKHEAPIGLAEEEIGLLREYRTRIVADVVTGKLDVREAAATLPKELEAFDDIEDDLLEDEEDLKKAELDLEAEEVEA